MPICAVVYTKAKIFLIFLTVAVGFSTKYGTLVPAEGTMIVSLLVYSNGSR